MRLDYIGDDANVKLAFFVVFDMEGIKSGKGEGGLALPGWVVRR